MSVTSLGDIFTNLKTALGSGTSLTLNDAALGTTGWLDPLCASALGASPSLSGVTLSSSGSSIIITGSATLLNTQSAQSSATITFAGGLPQLRFFAPLPSGWKFSTSFPAVAGTQFDHLSTLDSQFVFSTFAGTDAAHQVPIQVGLNYLHNASYGSIQAGAGNTAIKLRLATSDLDASYFTRLDIVSAILGSLDAMNLSLFVDQSQTPPTTGVMVTPFADPLSTGPLTWQSIQLFYVRSQCGLIINASLSVGSVVLDFAVNADVSTKSAALSLLFLGLRSASAPFTANSGQHVLWSQPFGIAGVSIDQLALGVDLTKKAAVLTLGGQVTLGDPQNGGCVIDVTAGVNGTGELQLITGALHAGNSAQSGVTLSSLLRALSPGLPLGAAASIFDFLKLQSLNAYLVAPGCSVPSPLDPLLIYPSGLTLSTRLSLFGITAAMDLSFDPTRGIKAVGSCDKFQLGPLSITNAAGDKGPRISIDTTGSKTSNVVDITGAASLWNANLATIELIAGLPATGLSFAIAFGSMTGVAGFSLAGTLNSTGVSAAAGINLTLPSTSFSVAVGGIHFFDVTIDSASITASLTVGIDRSGATTLSLDGSVNVAGVPFHFGFSPTQAVTDLSALPGLLCAYLKDNASTIFNALLGDLNHIAALIGQGVVSLAESAMQVMHFSYGKSVQDCANFLSGVGFNAVDASQLLATGFATALYGGSVTEVSSALRSAGYVAADVGMALQHNFLAPEAIASSALCQAGYAASDVIAILSSPNQALQGALAFTSWIGSNLLADAASVQVRVNAAMQSAATAAASGLAGAGYALTDVGTAIGGSIGKQFVLGAVAAAFVIDDVANYAKNILNLPADQLASFFKSGLNLGGDQVQSLLQGAGYAKDQIDGAMGSAYNWASNNLNPSHW